MVYGIQKGSGGGARILPNSRAIVLQIGAAATHVQPPPPSLRHFVTHGLLPPLAVLGCGFSLPVCGFVRTFD